MSAFAAAQRGSASLRGLTTTFRNTLALSSCSSSSSTSSSSTAAVPSSTRIAPRQAIAAFSTTSAPRTKTILMHRIPADAVPEYPYGPRLIYKQSNSGLHGTLRPRVGCNVSEDHHVRTPRTWRPNIHRKRLWSDALGCWVRTRLSMRVLRTIRKEGGLDAYVLGPKASRIKELGPGGWRLRWLVMQTRAVREKHAAERERLGVAAAVPAEADPDADPALAIDRDELVHIIFDSATPGPLGRKSKEYIEKRAVQLAAAEMASEMAAETLAGEFALGDEADVADDLLVPEDVEEEEAVHIGRDDGVRRP